MNIVVALVFALQLLIFQGNFVESRECPCWRCPWRSVCNTGPLFIAKDRQFRHRLRHRDHDIIFRDEQDRLRDYRNRRMHGNRNWKS